MFFSPIPFSSPFSDTCGFFVTFSDHSRLWTITYIPAEKGTVAVSFPSCPKSLPLPPPFFLLIVLLHIYFRSRVQRERERDREREKGKEGKKEAVDVLLRSVHDGPQTSELTACLTLVAGRTCHWLPKTSRGIGEEVELIDKLPAYSYHKSPTHWVETI
ncbi:hypothetical protein L209DRAFT_544498 [Thermothelomyces heterothallicus CBS 203.75]